VTETLPSTRTDALAAWGAPLQAAVCERCNWRYLLPQALAAGPKPPLCPRCFQAPLALIGDPLSEMPHPYPPELVVPFTLSEQALQESVRQFARGIPYAPKDLTYAAMRARLTPIYLPMWLVDAAVQAQWQAEAGFNYEVVSHQEYYADVAHAWQTREVREPRIRWEPRLGTIRRSCQNVSAPALEEARALREQLGEFDLAPARRYDPRCVARAWVRLPDRSTVDAWSDATAGFQRWAAGEVQKACAADHLRHFRWTASFDSLNWTLLLLPAYTTYYLDDRGQPQAVLLHGQTGRAAGRRRSSMQRARQASLIYFLIGVLLSILGLIAGGLGALVPVLAPLAVLGMLAGLLIMVAALIPIAIAWDFNRT